MPTKYRTQSNPSAPSFLQPTIGNDQQATAAALDKSEHDHHIPTYRERRALAQRLINAHPDGADGWTDQRIANATGFSRPTITRMRPRPTTPAPAVRS